MSWSLTIPTTKRECFADAVNFARQNGMADAKDIEAVKDAMKALAKRIRRPYIYAHAGRNDRDDDSIHVDVFGDLTAEPRSEWN